MMAPNLAQTQHELIHAMSLDTPISSIATAKAARCSVRSVNAIRANLRAFGTTRAPMTKSGRLPVVSPAAFEVLSNHLLHTPGAYLDEMVDLIQDQLDVTASTSTVSRTLRKNGWSKKVIRRIAQERNADLRDFHSHLRSEFYPDQLVYLDESGCNRRDGFRRTGWSPLGVAPVQIGDFHRGERYHILPAYCSDGVLFSLVYQGSTDSEVFEDFLEQLLPWCGQYPEPKSVLIMDNASFHRTPRVRQMCLDAGVKLLYLPPYSPDLNPIEELFAELKAFIKKEWSVYEDHVHAGFQVFLEWCIGMVGSKESSAQGHFRNAGIF